MAGCNNRNTYLHTGVSRVNRVLQALLPAYAKIDERIMPDLILFAREYARYLNYYPDSKPTFNNELPAPLGDWTMFMKMDVSVTLAAIAKLDTDNYFSYFDYLVNTIETTDASQTAELKKYYTSLFQFIYSLVYRLDDEWQHLPGDFGFTEYFSNMITSQMNELFWRVELYYKDPALQTLLNDAVLFIPDNAPVEISKVSELTSNHLSTIWNYTGTFDVQFEGNTDGEKIKYIAQHSIFKGTIELLLKAIAHLSQKANEWLDMTITSFQKHTPHYALYLTFIQLFKYAQNNLNNYTGRHLDFYYKKILQLKNNPAKPDFAHLVIELAKQTDVHLLKGGIAFKAGKDADNLERFYTLKDDTVLNKGSIKSIRSWMAKKNSAGTVLKVFAAPVANSGDGKGGDITSADKSWEPFGNNGNTDLARTGFSIAHSMLFMKEGTRYVEIKFTCSNIAALTVNPFIITSWFKARYTSPKGWTDAQFFYTYVIGNQLSFFVLIDNTLPAVVPYSEKVHAAGYRTGLPIMEFAINTNIIDQSPHLVLGALQVTSVDVKVYVYGLKDLNFQNEVSVLDPAKPFELFGPQPHIGSSLTIGSNEVFLKNRQHLVDATLHWEWDKMDALRYPPDPTGYIIDKTIAIKYLKNGTWQNVTTGYKQTILAHVHSKDENDIEYHVQPAENIQLQLPLFNTGFNFNATQPYDIASPYGFMKIVFTDETDFGHGDFVQRFTAAAVAGGTNLPPNPYTPTVKNCYINYNAEGYIQFNETTPPDDTRGHFYHITPFGHIEKSKAFSNTVFNLLAPFNDEGVLFIGIENFKADQSIQILFQLSEGSANPLKNRQDIQWSYLSANNLWKEFEDGKVTDATNDLTVSGIIRFGFPHDAVADTTLFPEQIFWIKAQVHLDTDAVCNIIRLHAQAILVEFTDYLNTGNFYKAVLPDSTISKLVVSDAAVKKITQPYASFGGVPVESDDMFYVRVSERLRHKNRAITIWDYEHLVLQNFTEVYKVKCLNHTLVTLNPDNTESDNELMPGHVVVVPLPDLRNKNAIDPLKPMVSLGILDEIKQFLRKHITPFVKLQVKNARFEEIQLEFKVKFYGDDTAYYHDVLQQDIEQYLSPWAYDAGADIEFGGKIYKSVLLDFVEERPYVDFVTCFKMYHYVDGIQSADVDEAVATSARTVLVSYGGAARHIIHYDNVDCNC